MPSLTICTVERDADEVAEVGLDAQAEDDGVVGARRGGSMATTSPASMPWMRTRVPTSTPRISRKPARTGRESLPNQPREPTANSPATPRPQRDQDERGRAGRPATEKAIATRMPLPRTVSRRRILCRAAFARAGDTATLYNRRRRSRAAKRSPRSRTRNKTGRRAAFCSLHRGPERFATNSSPRRPASARISGRTDGLLAPGGRSRMATGTSFKQLCPSCEAMVPIRDPGLIGRKIDCPKCKYRFVVEEPAEVEEEDGEPPPRRRRATEDHHQARRQGRGQGAGKAGPTQASGDDEDDDAQEEGAHSPVLLYGGGVLALVAVVGIGVGAVLHALGRRRQAEAASGDPAARGRAAATRIPGRPAGNDTGARAGRPDERHEPAAQRRPASSSPTPLGSHARQLAQGRRDVDSEGGFQPDRFRRTWASRPDEVNRIISSDEHQGRLGLHRRPDEEALQGRRVTKQLRLTAQQAVQVEDRQVVRRLPDQQRPRQPGQPAAEVQPAAQQLPGPLPRREHDRLRRPRA